MLFDLKTVALSLLVASASAAPVELSSRAVNPKKGLAYNNGALANGFKGTAAWGYSWNTARSGLDQSIEFVPMIHGAADPVAPLLASLSGAKYILGYNEPDMDTAHGGTATQPGVAAAAWKKLLPQLTGVKIGAPSITSNEGTGPIGVSGLNWMKQWVTAVGGGAATKVDFVPLHWYGVAGKSGAEQAGLLQTYLKHASSELNTMYGKSMPIWLTEFAAIPAEDPKLQADFLNAMIPFLDGYAPVARYSPFMVGDAYMTAQSASGQAFIQKN